MKRLDIIGKQFHQLTVIEDLGKHSRVRCECGNEKTVLRSNLLAGYTQSCGCLQRERTSKANKTHGHAAGHSPTYVSWKAMKTRCDNPQRDHADRYINRGITYHPRWSLFENFLVDMGERPEGMELDRINNSLGYSKENCRWATHKTNCNNRG